VRAAGGPLSFTAHVDGAARGNPGPAGFGVSIVVTGAGEVYARAGFLGETTNNKAEYRALLHCLEVLEELRLESGVVHSDSELLVKHLSGEYRVRDGSLRPLYQEAVERLSRLEGVSVRHIGREENVRADALANAGIDWGLKENRETAG